MDLILISYPVMDATDHRLIEIRTIGSEKEIPSMKLINLVINYFNVISKLYLQLVGYKGRRVEISVDSHWSKCTY